MVYDLTEYAHTNNVFYESIIHYGLSGEIDEVIEKYNKNHFPHYHNGIYVYLMDASTLPQQGWKIHVSATDKNAVDILNTLVPFLIQRLVPFKVIRNMETYCLLSQKPFSRVQYGKFITIYPSCTKQCMELLEELSDILQKFDGPRILTDRRYKNCMVLYYRYGGIRPQCEYDNQGMLHTYITDGLGHTVEDVRHPYFFLPDGIADIMEEESRNVDSYLFSEYDVKNALRFTNSGGAYIAVHRKTGEKVLIKEARPHTVLDGCGHDAIFFREKEATMLRELYSSGFVPRVVDAFFEQEHYFLVEEYIEGHTLFHFIMESNPIMRLESAEKVSDYLLQIMEYAEELCKFLAILHEKGYVLHDLTADNIMLTEDNHIKMIDLEGCTPIEQREKFMGKTIYDTLLKSDYADLCELGMLLFASLIKKDDLLSLKCDTVNEFLVHVQKYYTLPEKLIELILTLTNSPNHPSIQEILDDLSEIKKQIRAGSIKRIQIFKVDLNIDYESIIRANKLAVLGLYKKVNSFLFPVTPIVSNEFNITNGFVGVAKALNLLGCKELNNECAAMCEKITDDIPSGLYVGAAGCVWTLLEQNNTEIAQQIYHDKYMSLYDQHDFSLYSGKAGIGMVSIMMWLKTGNAKYLADAVECGNQVITFYCPDRNPYVGYKAGNAGISLFMLQLSLATKDSKYIRSGLDLLRIDLMRYKIQEGSTQICYPGTVDGQILYPYFMEGTAGILCVLLRYWAILKDDELREMAVKLADGLHYGFSVSATLYYGMAGIGNVLLDCAYYLSDKKYKQWAAELAEGCLRHMIDHKDYGVVFPDIYNRKISVDYGNGALGITLFLDRYVQNNNSNFAIPLDNEFLTLYKDQKEFPGN